MKEVILTLVVATCIIAFSSFRAIYKVDLPTADSTFTLEYISHYPVKIDGGCRFITYDSLPLNKREFIFIISAKQVAFMELKNKEKSILLKQVSKESLPDKTSVETFIGQGYQAVLKTKQVKGLQEDWPYSKGTLQITFQKVRKIYNIHGTKS